MSRTSTRKGAAATDGWERRRSILLNEYERLALDLFAERGYHEVTVDDIAQAAGVTTRTLFRYFPSKQDVLLGLPRRGLAAEIEMIDSLEPTDDPIATAWAGLLEFVANSPVDPSVVGLWDAATANAPELRTRVHGERIDALFQAFLRYGERCYGVAHDEDSRPRWLAGLLAGIEHTLVEAVAQAPAVVDDLEQAIGGTVRVLSGAPLRPRRRRASLSLTD